MSVEYNIYYKDRVDLYMVTGHCFGALLSPMPVFFETEEEAEQWAITQIHNRVFAMRMSDISQYDDILADLPDVDCKINKIIMPKEI